MLEIMIKHKPYRSAVRKPSQQIAFLNHTKYRPRNKARAYVIKVKILSNKLITYFLFP